ncbi:MAG: thermonuclease family protein [Bacillota bacterium]
MMKQRFLFAVIVSIFVLCGCGTRNETTDRPSNTPQDGPAAQHSTAKRPDSRNAGQQAELPATLVEGIVTRVVDGDTSYIRIAGGLVKKVRFTGIDTPETGHPKTEEPYGKEAAEYTRSRILDRRVWLEVDVQERDRYGRLLAYVWLIPPAEISDAEIRNHLLNADLLLNGYAQMLTMPPNVKYVTYFRRCQTEAREKKRGLHGMDGQASKRDN